MPDLRVRYQLAFTLGEIKGEGRDAALATLARRDGDDRWMRLAIQSSLAEGAAEVIALLLADAESRRTPATRSMLESLASQIGVRNRPAEIAALVGSLESLPKEDAALVQQLVRGLSEGLSQGGRSLREALLAGRASVAAADCSMSCWRMPQTALDEERSRCRSRRGDPHAGLGIAG